MNTKRFILTNILVWLPMLVLDRLSRHIAIAITTEPLNYWGDEPSLLFNNVWNPSLLGGFFPSELTILTATFGIPSFVVLLVYVCYILRTPVKIMWPLVPVIFSAVSNLSDRFIWGMVSDPFVLTFGSDIAVAINIADVGCLIGGTLLGITLMRDIRRNRLLYSYTLAAKQGFNYGGTR